MRAINIADPRPASKQLADHIAHQIGAGELLPGDKLPSASELRTSWFPIAYSSTTHHGPMPRLVRRR